MAELLLPDGRTIRRIQLRRTKGWRKPEGAIVVSRPTRWGNPNDWRRDQPAYGPKWLADGELNDDPRRYSDDERRQWSVDHYRTGIEQGWTGYPTLDEIREHLAGHDLACWCPPGSPCHADVLLRLANPDAVAIPTF